MKEKINIAELLRDCPKGMELDCTMYDDVYFDYVDKLNIIHCYIQHETYNTSITFNQHGTYNSDIKSKCAIFPKGKTTWEGFHRPFKDGDVVFTTESINENSWISIFKRNNRNKMETYADLCIDSNSCYYGHPSNILGYYENITTKRLATEEEKQKLFDAIKANGYKWNVETKTLEKLIEPKFKVGDRIRHKTTNKEDVYEINKVYDDSYGLVGFTWMIYMKYQDQYELIPNKFDINTLKPFDKVLVRHCNGNIWCASFLSHIDKDLHSYCYKFVTIAGKSYPKMIPYEGNEHLLGTKDDCNEYYKIWEDIV